MSLLLNLLRDQRTAQPKYYGGGQNAQMLTLRDMLLQKTGQMPYSQGAHVLRTNTLSPDAQGDQNMANTQANLQANLQANAMFNLESNTPANVPANTPANVPAAPGKGEVTPGKGGPAQSQATAPATPATPVTPAVQAPGLTTPAAPRTVTVLPGDTLSSIAQREFGRASRWSEIYALNRDKIPNPNLIRPGMVLTLPLAGNNNAPVPVPQNLPSVPGNVPATVPENTPANAPANVPAQDDLANQANAMVDTLSGLITQMKTPQAKGGPVAQSQAVTPAQTPAAGPVAQGPSTLPPGLLALRQNLKPVTDPEALKGVEAARKSLVQSNPELAATPQGKELVDVYAQIVGQMLQKPAHLRKPPRDGAGWVERANYNAQWLSWKRQIENMFRPVQETVVQATAQANQQTSTQTPTVGPAQQTVTQAPGPRPLPGTPAYEALFAQNLRIGIETLQRAGLRFGRADNQAKGQFDSKYWTIQADAQYGAMLVHNGTGTPHQAIDEMFANVGRWTMDCAEFVQAAQLYAQRQTLGADAFDSKFSSAKLSFRVHGSAGVNTKTLYHADSAGAKPVAVTPQGKRTVDQSMDDILRAAPVGSRVMWTNPYAPATSAWLNENSVKIGDDLFAAHPMGTLPSAAIVKRLHNANPSTANQASRVFLRQVEVYYSH